LKETDFCPSEIDSIFALSAGLKARRLGNPHRPLEGQSWGMLFFKNSTRTRISFDVGLHELGAKSVFLDQKGMQLSRGESVADTAKVASRYLHGMIIRAFEHELVEEFAREGSIPVINALTDFLHPCQMYTDAFTMAEHFAGKGNTPSLEQLRGRKVAFLGDCACNMANSWILGACLMGMEVVLSGPSRFAPGARIKDEVAGHRGLSGSFRFTEDPADACKDADVIYTDVWVSMGDEDEADLRRSLLAPYQVNRSLLSLALPGAIFMHCLPAHAGEEVTQEVLDCGQSIVFDQAENRLHVQKAILSGLLHSGI
jgi:ornithine carbamoyltransferase